MHHNPKKAYLDGLNYKEERNPHEMKMKFIWDFIKILVATYCIGLPIVIALVYLIANILWP